MASSSDSGGGTGFEIKDNLTGASPKIKIEQSSVQQVPQFTIPCFNFSSLSAGVLERPSCHYFSNLLTPDLESGYHSPQDNLGVEKGYHRYGPVPQASSNVERSYQRRGSVPQDNLNDERGYHHYRPSAQDSSIFESGYHRYNPFPQTNLQCKLRTLFANPERRKHLCGMIPHVKNYLDERKLRMAANFNNTGVTKALLDDGVNPRGSDKRLRTALHFASSKGYCDIVAMLLKRGADPNQKDALGNTPLHLAACTSHMGVITLLLKHGADPKLLDNIGRSPMQLAQLKLRLLQVDKSRSSEDIKNEVLQVINMLHMYLQKTGLDAQAELISEFSTRLTLSQSKEEATGNVQDLLSKLSDLKLERDT